MSLWEVGGGRTAARKYRTERSAPLGSAPALRQQLALLRTAGAVLALLDIRANQPSYGLRGRRVLLSAPSCICSWPPALSCTRAASAISAGSAASSGACPGLRRCRSFYGVIFLGSGARAPSRARTTAVGWSGSGSAGSRQLARCWGLRRHQGLRFIEFHYVVPRIFMPGSRGSRLSGSRDPRRGAIGGPPVCKISRGIVT